MSFVRSLGALGLCLSLSLLASPANATPVSRADISGRKICWDSGDIETYSPDGKYGSKANGPGTWQFIAAGTVTVIANNWNWAWGIQKLADGSLVGDASQLGYSWHWTGHYCK